jgi:capsular polysaccharide transport system permease protein
MSPLSEGCKPEHRQPLMITLGVWRALFLRESLARLFASRSAWVWVFTEPVFHVAYLMFLFTAVRVRTVGGIATAVWIMVGLLGFFMFRRTGTQMQKAVSDNQALFVYRQVKPVDAVLVRASLEGFLMVIIALLLLAGASLMGFAVMPADPLAVLEAFFGLWLVGLGFGLITSVVSELVGEMGQVIKLIMRPMYLISGVIFPLGLVPQPYREWLMLNPVPHGLEAARLGFAPYYHAVPELSLSYMYGFALVTIFFGLALHRRFAVFLVAK